MITNSAVTIYRRVKRMNKDTFEMKIIQDAWWSSRSEGSVGTGGIVSSSSKNVSVRIPDIDQDIVVGDIIVKGEGYEIESVKQLLDYHVIVSVKYNSTGLNKHISIGAV